MYETFTVEDLETKKIISIKYITDNLTYEEAYDLKDCLTDAIIDFLNKGESNEN